MYSQNMQQKQIQNQIEHILKPMISSNQKQACILKEITIQISNSQYPYQMSNHSFKPKLSHHQKYYHPQSVLTDEKISQPIVHQQMNLINTPNDLKQCKICLQSEQSQQNELVSPCDCDGSLKYVHNLCFETWIHRKYQLQQQNNENISDSWSQCQICHQKYDIIYTLQNHCSKKEKICIKLKQHWLFAILTLFVSSISLVSLILCISAAISDLQSATFNILQKRYFAIYGAIFFSLCAFYWVSREFVRLYLIQGKINFKINNKEAKHSNQQLQSNKAQAFLDEQLTNQMTNNNNNI